MNITRTEPLPFSDYVIFYFVDIFGVELLDFYYTILFMFVAFAIAGWVFAMRMFFNCKRDIKAAVEEEQNK